MKNLSKIVLVMSAFGLIGGTMANEPAAPSKKTVMITGSDLEMQKKVSGGYQIIVLRGHDISLTKAEIAEKRALSQKQQERLKRAVSQAKMDKKNKGGQLETYKKDNESENMPNKAENIKKTTQNKARANNSLRKSVWEKL